MAKFFTNEKASFQEASISDFCRSGWFVAYSPKQWLVGWGEWHEAAEADSGTCCLYAPDFFLTARTPWRFTRYWDMVDRDLFSTHVLAGVASEVNGFNKMGAQGFQWLEPDLNGFKEGPWFEIQKGFSERGLRKAVPIVFASAEGQISIPELLKRIVATPSTVFPYGVWDQGGGLMGVTPEVLFRRGTDGATVETMALAGTQAKTEHPARLLADSKERYEHQLVVEDIKDRLVKIGNVAVGSTEVLELPALYHLHTRIQARLSRQIGFEELVKLLHPTPALGVAPRNQGFEEILRWSPSERGRFGAPFGVSSPLGEQCLVAIRSVEWQGANVRIGSGCGVVPESQLEREWRELALKRESVKRMLGL